MRVVTVLWLVLALVSQGAVARVHLMPSSVDSVDSHQTAQASHHHEAAKDTAEMDCHSVKSAPKHNCCDELETASMDCHSAKDPCDGECGHCKIYSPASAALLPEFPLTAVGQETLLPTRAPHYLSIALDQEIPPPHI